MIRVKVPATSANMGAGFDSLGIALSLYNTIDVTEISHGIQIRRSANMPFAADENNLIYRAMQKVFTAADFSPKGGIRISQKSDIPMTRGLGSSSACIAGGMIAANIIAGRPFDYGALLDMATEMEGHPDNAAPAFFGGFCASAVTEGHVEYVSFKPGQRFGFAVMIPDFFVATKKSRTALPELVTHKDAAHNVSRAALFALAMATGKAEALKTGVDDRLHQPYRKGYIDGIDEIFEKTYEAGSLATYISGSGPTVLSVLTDGREDFKHSMESFFEKNSHKWTCRILSVDNVGAVAGITGEYKMS